MKLFLLCLLKMAPLFSNEPLFLLCLLKMTPLFSNEPLVLLCKDGAIIFQRTTVSFVSFEDGAFTLGGWPGIPVS